MLRTLIAFLHIISFSFIFSTDVNELKKEEFKAEINTPGSIDKASEGIVEIVFTVGSVKGFAKLTDNLPAGVIAEAVDMGNATFTFSNGVLKIIWLNFPFPVVLRQAIYRTIKRAYTRETICNGNTESFRKSFFSKDSILIWVLKTHKSMTERYTKAKFVIQKRAL